MSRNKIKPPEEVIDYFRSLGFQHHVITDSVFRDKHDVPIHFFQTDSKFHTADCSTILADDAIKIFKESQHAKHTRASTESVTAK